MSRSWAAGCAYNCPLGTGSSMCLGNTVLSWVQEHLRISQQFLHLESMVFAIVATIQAVTNFSGIWCQKGRIKAVQWYLVSFQINKLQQVSYFPKRGEDLCAYTVWNRNGSEPLPCYTSPTFKSQGHFLSFLAVPISPLNNNMLPNVTFTRPSLSFRLTHTWTQAPTWWSAEMKHPNFCLLLLWGKKVQASVFPSGEQRAILNFLSSLLSSSMWTYFNTRCNAAHS